MDLVLAHYTTLFEDRDLFLDLLKEVNLFKSSFTQEKSDAEMQLQSKNVSDDTMEVFELYYR